MLASFPPPAAGRLRGAPAPRARVLIIAALLAFFGLVASLADPRGVRQLRRLRRDLLRQESANDALRRQNVELARVARELGPSGGRRAIEKAAREQLGFVRDDEVVFKFEAGGGPEPKGEGL